MRTLPDAVRGKSETMRSSSGHFWPGHADLFEVGRDVGEVDRGHARREPDQRARVLAEPRVGRGDHDDLGDQREGREGFFDLGRGDVLAAPDDHVLQPVRDREEAVGVDDAHVAGAVPARRVERGRGQRGIGVAGAEVGPA